MLTSEVEWMYSLNETTCSRGFGRRILRVSNSVNAWVWMAYDQLNLELIRDIEQRFGTIGLVFIESEMKGRSRPYHKQKLALLLSNQRHFSLEAQAQGYAVQYIVTKGDYAGVIEALAEPERPIHCIEAAEYSTRLELESLIDSGHLVTHPHRGWLTPRNWFVEAVGTTPPFRMDRFYRKVRTSTGWLMTNGQPVGGKYSFDEENRKPVSYTHLTLPTILLV